MEKVENDLKRKIAVILLIAGLCGCLLFIATTKTSDGKNRTDLLMTKHHYVLKTANEKNSKKSSAPSPSVQSFMPLTGASALTGSQLVNGGILIGMLVFVIGILNLIWNLSLKKQEKENYKRRWR